MKLDSPKFIEGVLKIGFLFLLLGLIWHCLTYYKSLMGSFGF